METRENNHEFDVNKPLTNPVLSELLNRWESANSQDEDAVNAIIEEIAKEVALNARFLSVVNLEEASTKISEDTVVLNKDTRVSFPCFRTDDGRAFFPVFTDWDELRKGEELKNAFVKTMILSFDDYYDLVKDNSAGIVINPFGANFVLSNENIRHMKARKEQQAQAEAHVLQKDTQILLAEPKEYPQEMVNAVCAHARQLPQIKAIWLKLMVMNGEQSFLFVVDHTGDRQAVFDGIGHVASAYLPQGMCINMVPRDDSFGQGVAEENVPFYQQQKTVDDEPDMFGETPLLKAVKKGQVEDVKNLISQGANVNFVNQFKESVLMVAVKKNQADMVKLLIEAGADIHYKDVFGKSVLKVAEQKGFADIAELLKSAGAKE